VSHRYKVREIAQQAGLSEATVDRVLHNRPNVRESTRREVEQAIGDLDKQRSQLRLAGRKYLVDVVMQAPQRFSSAFQAAVEAELPRWHPRWSAAAFISAKQGRRRRWWRPSKDPKGRFGYVGVDNRDASAFERRGRR